MKNKPVTPKLQTSNPTCRKPTSQAALGGRPNSGGAPVDNDAQTRHQHALSGAGRAGRHGSQDPPRGHLPPALFTSEVARGEKMLYAGSDPESYITEYTLICTD